MIQSAARTTRTQPNHDPNHTTPVKPPASQLPPLGLTASGLADRVVTDVVLRHRAANSAQPAHDPLVINELELINPRQDRFGRVFGYCAVGYRPTPQICIGPPRMGSLPTGRPKISLGILRLPTKQRAGQD